MLLNYISTINYNSLTSVFTADDHSSTIMLLLNAVYFKGKWQVPFMENQTESRKFYLNEKDEVPVSMMNTTERFYYSNLDNVKAEMIKLPYVVSHKEMSLTVIKVVYSFEILLITSYSEVSS